MKYEELDIRKNFVNYYEEDFEKIIDVFAKAQSAQLPVLDKGEIAGILDIFALIQTEKKSANLTDLMIKDFKTVSIDKPLDESDIENLTQKILPFLNNDGGVEGFIETEVIKNNLLEKKHLEETNKLLNLTDELNAILDLSHDSIFVTDGKGVVTRINKEGERLDEVKASDVIGKHMDWLVAEKIYSNSVALKVLEEKRPVTMLQKTRNGKELLSTGTPIFKNGEIYRVVVNCHDVTELNSLKDELQNAKQKAEKIQSELEELRIEQIKAEDVVTNNIEMRKILIMAKRVAKVDSTILIEGESGVGKEMMSKFIHSNSMRKDKPFIKIDCSSIPEKLIESELFGYEKGAFTGANKEGRIGLIEMANEGTLFLDEIGELPLNMQSKFLRALQDRSILRIGGKETVHVDIRVIAATNRNLKEMVKSNLFREDLFYRLNVVPVFIPSLRERKEDIQFLTTFFLDKFNVKYGFNKRISPKCLRYLIEYDWPGNVRELENIIERSIVTSEKDVVEVNDLPINIIGVANRNCEISDKALTLKDQIETYEKSILLREVNGSKSIVDISKKLGMDASTIRRKLNKYCIKNPF